MEKKLKSKPMQSIINNLAQYNELQIIQFKEEMFLNEPIENWPEVDVLISFYSKGFPMEKALKYVNNYKPI
jgi:inositol hexakisphosphate/diphosphoinositol-pentakisphosphate kinase